MKNKGLIFLIILLILIIAFVIFAYYKGWIGNYVHTISGDSTPVTDYSCDAKTSEKVDCTRPLYNATEGASQISYIMDSEAYPYLDCLNSIKDKNGKQWFLNYSSGLSCVYIDDISNPAFYPLTEIEQKFWDGAFKNAISEILSSLYICNCSSYSDQDQQLSYISSRRHYLADALKKRNKDVTSIFWKRDFLNKVPDLSNQSSKKLQNLLVCDAHNYYGC